jgi:small subunit ribosomal protein S9
MHGKKYFATGKRKTAIARIWMEPGDGKFVINKRTLDEYFGLPTLKMIIRQPLELTDSIDKYDIHANVFGGGISGQADAIKHAIAKALLLINPEFRQALKRTGLLTRDARIKERKKYGLKGARKRFQYSKR